MLSLPQRHLWEELEAVAGVRLYGWTALALQLGHRTSVDFDFFGNQLFDPVQEPNTLSAVIERGRAQFRYRSSEFPDSIAFEHPRRAG